MILLLVSFWACPCGILAASGVGAPGAAFCLSAEVIDFAEVGKPLFDNIITVGFNDP